MIVSERARIKIMNALQRHELVLMQLRERSFLSLQDVMQLTGASAATARRDAELLARRGLLRRAHGGVGQADPGTMLPFTLRQREHSSAKLHLARQAVTLLKPGEVLMIDGGSTTFHIGACLPSFPLRVITNSLHLATVLEERARTQPGLEVYLTGGCLYGHGPTPRPSQTGRCKIRCSPQPQGDAQTHNPNRPRPTISLKAREIVKGS